MGAAVGLQPVRNIVHDRTIVVTHCGRICLGRKKINFSQVFAGQAVGIRKCALSSALFTGVKVPLALRWMLRVFVKAACGKTARAV
jgi:hypothetical protein